MIEKQKSESRNTMARCFEIVKYLGHATFHILGLVVYPLMAIVIWLSANDSHTLGRQLTGILSALAQRAGVVQIHPWLLYDGPLDPVGLFIFGRFCGIYEDLMIIASIIYMIGELGSDPTEMAHRMQKKRPLQFPLLVQQIILIFALCVLSGGTWFFALTPNIAHVDKLVTLLYFGWLLSTLPSVTIMLVAAIISIIVSNFTTSSVRT